jgi:alpha,alpha-trehalose phosphorylase
MAAAQIGYDDLAVTYFRETLFVDLADTHGNANDGVHVASAGGVWGTIAFGFAGLFDSGTALQFTPSLPSAWEGVRFRMQRHGARMLVELDADGCTVTALDGPPVPLHVEEDGAMRTVQIEAGSTQRIPRVRLPAPT